MAIPRPLTNKQLFEIVACYAAEFSDWKIINKQVFARICGPIVQHIGFETLRSGAYRPWSALGCLPLPNISMFYQLLDVKHRVVLIYEHTTKWRGIINAMEQQFQPPIRRPLDLREVKVLCEQEARGCTNDLCMLAVLHGYLGEAEKALSCCERMQLVGPSALAPRQHWEQRHREFGRRLQQEIEAGNERRFLDTAAGQI
jgi:hypothetical protein